MLPGGERTYHASRYSLKEASAIEMGSWDNRYPGQLPRPAAAVCRSHFARVPTQQPVSTFCKINTAPTLEEFISVLLFPARAQTDERVLRTIPVSQAELQRQHKKAQLVSGCLRPVFELKCWWQKTRIKE